MNEVFVYWLVDVSQLYSHTNEEYYFRLEFIDDATGELLKTYVSDSNLNFRNWKPIIEAWHPEVALGLSGIKKTVKPGLLNADSKPYLIHEVDRDTFLQTAQSLFYPEGDSK